MFIDFLTNLYSKSVDKNLIGFSEFHKLDRNASKEETQKSEQKFNNRFVTNGQEIVSRFLTLPPQDALIRDYLKIFVKKPEDKKDFEG